MITKVAEQPASSVAIVAEKPSVARDIARVVGAAKKGEGYLYGGGYVVTWAVGHLVRLAQPHEIRPEWKAWRRDRLPMLPREWPLVVIDQTRDQFEIVRKILNSPKVSSVLCATDAGREGELIFRYAYEAAGCSKPVSRLWISSLTPDAIRNGLDVVKDWAHYDSLADAARGRSRADWLVGMNLSRAYTLALSEDFSVGRVQTPTLAMVVQRELEIRAFVPEDYLEVVATFSPGAASEYKGTWFREGVEPLQAAMRLPAGSPEAEAIVNRAGTGEARIESVKSETQRMAPPLLYDLTELQRHANRLFGFSAQKTLDLAQALYERHKLISYPRTDSRHLSEDVAKTLPRIVSAIREPYTALLAPGTGERPLGRRFVDDSKVTDHHAIIPTHIRTDRSGLNADEARVYDLVCRRLLSAWHADHVWAVTTVITAVTNPGVVDRYHSSGTAVEQPGWKVLDIAPQKTKKGAAGESGGDEAAQALPPGLAEAQQVQVLDASAVHKKTRPPRRFTDATLLTAMETAGKTLDEKELADAMKDCGLGTPATRAAIIEVLLKRGYIERRGKALEATQKGIRLIEVVHPEVKSPAMTGQWEAGLERIRRGEAALEPFMDGIERYVTEVIGKVGQSAAPPSTRPPRPTAPPPAIAAPVEPGPPQASADGDLLKLLQSTFGFQSFRANQEAVCRAVIRGQDALLVMPTGSGKSLCYQLPGIARGGTTLVISPLIALMEDQVASLREKGFAADRIHSGRDRAASRQACIDYLNGKLQFLFIAPERLRVPGFPEMLAKRKPSLIAIDEAHCISQWGHDFRPDYRRIGQYLPSLRPAPVVALTATATPLVQHDIHEQLALAHASRFIHGFRRENIGIEVVEILPSAREALVKELLSDSARRPAIVYTPTRRESEELAATLNRLFSAAPYHAGMDSKRRDKVQEGFLAGKTEVIVATIAFGMGIDKPDVRTVIHTALPGSIEAYYQEIGRAGRDGGPARAILMQSYSDRRTHDFFYERDYPEPSILDAIFSRLTAESQPKEAVQKATRMDAEAFDTALEKLWIHGGVQIDYEENLSRGVSGWRPLYEAQREHKLAQLTEMLRFAECNQCRMVALVRHFGDRAGAQERCGICDFCASSECIAQRFRVPTAEERALGGKTIAALRGAGVMSAGRLHAQVCGQSGVERHAFERVLSGLVRAGLIDAVDAVFEKDGKEIAYKRLSLTAAGRALAPDAAIDFELTAEVAGHGLRPKKRRGKLSKRSTAPAPEVSANVDGELEQSLRQWRAAEAKKAGVPAFRVFSDRTLRALVEELPADEAALLLIPGLTERKVRKYGGRLLNVMYPPAPGPSR